MEGVSNEDIVSELTKDLDDQCSVKPEDEEMLKEWELTLTDQEKEAKRIEAVSHKDAGNELFKRDDFASALESYDKGLQNCPLTFTKERAVLFSNRAAAKIKLGRTKSALEDCTKAVELDREYVRAFIRRATLHEQLNQLDEALADWKCVLELQPELSEAVAATQRLPPLIEEKNEKLKAEMLDKLKSLGNMILRPFGLSSNNFQMVPNGEGGYSVQFQK